MVWNSIFLQENSLDILKMAVNFLIKQSARKVSNIDSTTKNLIQGAALILSSASEDKNEKVNTKFFSLKIVLNGGVKEWWPNDEYVGLKIQRSEFERHQARLVFVPVAVTIPHKNKQKVYIRYKNVQMNGSCSIIISVSIHRPKIR